MIGEVVAVVIQMSTSFSPEEYIQYSFCFMCSLLKFRWHLTVVCRRKEEMGRDFYHGIQAASIWLY